MAVRQLTLYDVLADLVPGSFLLVLAGVAYTVVGLQSPALSTGLGSGLAFVILSYLTGRTLHALAGQERIKQFRKKLDYYIYRHNQTKEWVNYEPIVGEPAFRGYINGDDSRTDAPSVGLTNQEGNFNEDIQEALPSHAAERFGEMSEEHIRNNPTEFRRFAYSYLFDSSTLYQRYNIQETFYRNLWLAATLGWITFSLLTITHAILYLIDWRLDPSLWDGVVARLVMILLVALSILFAIRRIQFKYRQERALINDLYIHLSEGGDGESSDG